MGFNVKCNQIIVCYYVWVQKNINNTMAILCNRDNLWKISYKEDDIRILVAIVAIAIVIIQFLSISSFYFCLAGRRRKNQNGRGIDLPLKVFQITGMD